MIKVYIFITGLALYQFASSPGKTSYVILPSGHFDFPGLSHSAAHEIKVLSGDKAKEVVGLTLPLEAKFEVACPVGGCSKITEPEKIPSLVDLLGHDGIIPKLKPGCTVFDGGKTCHPQGMKVPGRNGLLAFTGNWKVKALTDCGGSAYPETDGPFVKMNYVRAGKSWELFFDDLGKLRPVVNTVLFTAEVEKIEDLQISNAELVAQLASAKLTICEHLPDFSDSAATQCAAILVRNGNNEPYIGGGDRHFVGLYALLDNKLEPAKLWLPIASTENVCKGGGGTGGLSFCAGGRLPSQ